MPTGSSKASPRAESWSCACSPTRSRRTPTTMASATEAPAPPAGVTSPVVRILRERLAEQVLGVAEFRGDLAVTVSRKAWVEAARLLRDHPELDFKLFLDLCAVDYLDKEDRE